MKKIFLIGLILVLSISLFASKWENSMKPKGESVVVKNINTYTIVVPHNLQINDDLASRDLAFYLGKIYNTEFKIVHDDESVKEPFISIGDTKYIKANNINVPNLNADGYSLIYKDKNIYINGGWSSLALNGVYSLLEEDLDCRFWTKLKDDTIPVNKTNTLTFVPRHYNPPFLIRHYNTPEYFDGQANTVDPTTRPWRFKNRLKQWNPEGGCHTCFRYVSKENFKDHPEWFSEYNGIREPKQLCYSNDEMIDVMVNNILEALRNSDHNEVFCVSPADAIPCCACPKCEAYDKAHGNTKCASLIRAMNIIAKAVKKEFPNTLVQTLAYKDTIIPPTDLPLEDNLGIVICSDSCDWNYPLCDYEESEFFQNNAKEWRKICKNVMSWTYVTNYDHLLLPNPNNIVIANDIRIMENWKLNGIYLQSINAKAVNTDGYFRSWVWSKLLWNPNLNLYELTKDYCYGYYGDEIGEEILKYETSLYDMYKNAHAVPHDANIKPEETVVGNLTVSEREDCEYGVVFKYGIRWTPDEKIYSDEWINNATKIFDKCMSLCKTDEEREKVKYVKIDIDYLRLCKMLGYQTLKSGWVKKDLNNVDTELSNSLLEELESVLDKYNVSCIAEMNDIYQTWPNLRKKWKHNKDINMDKIGMNSIETSDWKFIPDDDLIGVSKGYYKTDYDTSSWKNIEIGKTWDEQNFGFHSNAWYKKKINIDIKSLEQATELYLLFGAVDEDATVYVNGELVCEHTMDKLNLTPIEIWTRPFFVKFKKYFKLGENDITIMVGNSERAGGIYKPMKLCWTFREVPDEDIEFLAE